MYRTPTNEAKYKKDRAVNLRCPFCTPNKTEILGETISFYILNNIYGYDLWDRRKVKRHLLIVSKIHSVGLGKTKNNVPIEYFKLLKKYLNLGYDIFTRSTTSKTKTQPHFHTHLIKTNSKLFNKINFRADPYELTFRE